MTHKQEDGQPITSNMLIKWGAVLAALCTTLVSLVWFCASVKQEQAIQHEDIQAVKKQVDELKARQSNTEKSVDELNRKLDVAVTILQRIDAKVNRP